MATSVPVVLALAGNVKLILSLFTLCNHLITIVLQSGETVRNDVKLALLALLLIPVEHVRASAYPQKPSVSASTYSRLL